jgi:hypothetical protein
MFLTYLNRKIVLFLIFLPVTYLMFSYSHGVMYAKQSDESYNLKYSQLVEEKGLEGVGTLFKWYSNDPEAVLHPSPMRIGYIVPMAGLFKVFGVSPKVMDIFSTICFFLTLAICYYYSRKFFNKDIALILLLLMSYSPLLIGISQRALVDSEVCFCWCFLIWLVYDHLQNPDAIKKTGLVMLLSFSILLKESSIIFIPILFFSALIFRRESLIRTVVILAWACVIDFLIYTFIFHGTWWFKQDIKDILKEHICRFILLRAVV